MRTTLALSTAITLLATSLYACSSSHSGGGFGNQGGAGGLGGAGCGGGLAGWCGAGVTLGGGGKFYGATFAPVGTVDANNEALVVANTLGDLYQVDVTSGNLTDLGNFGTVTSDDGNGNRFKYPGTVFQLSGDIV